MSLFTGLKEALLLYANEPRDEEAVSCGDFDGAPFWSCFGCFMLHAELCACH